MNDEVLVDDVELNQGDAYDGENECQHHHVVYAANGIAISMPPYWDDFSFSIETTKYNAWWEYRENVFRAFRKNGDDRIDLFSIPQHVKVKCPCNSLCFKCDPTGIERFYQQYGPYKDCIDPKDIWYEFCALREEREIDDKIDEKDVPEEIYNCKDSWT